MASKQYKVYFTPRTGEFTYGTEVEISDAVLMSGVKTMKKSIDSGDFEVGVYVYGDISIKAINKNGYLGDETDSRSIFNYSRDLAKVRVTYVDSDGESTRFTGLINEEATKENFEKEELTFRVLSLDSVLRTTKIPAGIITDGVSASTAFGSILNVSKITSVLNYSAGNINPNVDITIDNGSYFDNKTVRKGLNDLLLASNSVMLIDSSQNIIIKSRENNTLSAALALYGPYDERSRQNIISVKKYNRGFHRTFTSIDINGTVSTNVPYSLDYGYRQKALTLSFITTTATETSLGESLVDEFKQPRLELEVECETSVVKNYGLLDNVSINYPLRVKRYDDSFLPVIGDTQIGDAASKLPYVFGNNSISPNIAFKIIEISENPASFTTTLKVRQTTDGFLSAPSSSFVGFAIVGESTIGGTGDTCAKFYSAPVSAGQIGCTKIA